MGTHLKIALALGALILATAPAALAGKPADPGANASSPHYETEKPEKPEKPTPGPGASLPEKAKAYGVYCKAESKKHVEGEKGTPFSQCVTAMAKAAKSERMTARQACKGLSKKHVKGEQGTAFSRCVKAAAQLRKAQA